MSGSGDSCGAGIGEMRTLRSTYSLGESGQR